MSTRQRLTAEARRELIEQAASETFAERGYHGASIGEIARRSGVSAPVVYDHFDSKQDLYKSLLERHQSDLLRLWRAQLAGDDPPEQRIRRALEAWFEYIEAHPAWLMVFRDAPPELADFHREIRARGLESLSPLTAREGIADSAPRGGYRDRALPLGRRGRGDLVAGAPRRAAGAGGRRDHEPALARIRAGGSDQLELTHRVALLDLSSSTVASHALLREVVEIESLDDLVGAARAGARGTRR